MPDFLQPILDSVLKPVYDEVLSWSWTARALSLLAALGLISLVKYRGRVRSLLADGYAYVQVRGQKEIPLSPAQRRKLEETIDALKGFLSSELLKPRPDGINAWTTAQLIASLAGQARLDGDKLRGFFTENRGADPLWREFPAAQVHFAVAGWVLSALARVDRPASREELDFILRHQSPDGWWSIYPATRDRVNACTYATAWLVLALAQQRRKGLIAADDLDKVGRAVEGGRSWLESARTQGKVRWQDYPFSPEGKESLSLSGLVLHAVTTTGPRNPELCRGWLKGLPEALPQVKDNETSGAGVQLSEKEWGKDSTRHYILQWLLIATVDAFPDGDLQQRVRAKRLVEAMLSGMEETRRQVRELPWLAAELQLGLRYLRGDGR